jgi:excisionase family DNA binding protein
MHENDTWRKKLAELARDRPAIRVDEAGKFLGLGRSAAYDAALSGQLSTVQFGRKLLVPVDRLEALLAA